MLRFPAYPRVGLSKEAAFWHESCLRLHLTRVVGTQSDKEGSEQEINADRGYETNKFLGTTQGTTVGANSGRAPAGRGENTKALSAANT